MYLAFDERPPSFLASNSGWNAFCAWADDLPLPQCEQVVILCEHGWSQELEAVRQQLGTAPAPQDHDVQEVRQNLLSLLQGENGAAVITDGMGPDREEPPTVKPSPLRRGKALADGKILVQPAAERRFFIARWQGVGLTADASLALGKGDTQDAAVRDLLSQTTKQDLYELSPYTITRSSQVYGF